MSLSEGVVNTSRDDCSFSELFLLEVFFGRFLLREDLFFELMPLPRIPGSYQLMFHFIKTTQAVKAKSLSTRTNNFI